jgi:diguanylate cyclase (GGDEF)-like protein
MGDTRNAAAARERQVCMDLHERSLLGGVFYFVAWVLVGGFGGAFTSHLLASGVLCAAFAAGTLLRLVLHRRMLGLGMVDARTARPLWALVVGTGALWAVASVWALLDPHFLGTDLVNLVSTVALATAFAQVYSIDLARGALGTAVLYLPPLAVVWTLEGMLPVAAAMSAHLVYLFAVLVRTNAEYRRRLDLDEALRVERDRYEALSRLDALTGVANRRRFSEVLEQEFELARAGGTLSLAVIDIDHFKQINDRHGHASGDACLREVAQRLRNGFAAASVIARLGGEEFGVLFPGEPADAAAALAESFRRDLEREPVVVAGVPIAVTTSIGIADARGRAGSEALFRAADRALYRAKEAGRNRVESADGGAA